LSTQDKYLKQLKKTTIITVKQGYRTW